MWEALIKLVEKWACCHKWELHRRMSTYNDDSSNRPWKVEETLICQKCGKIKKNYNLMKQYLSPEQTAKLIELGFEKPKNERWVLDVANESTPSIQNIVKCQDYSIGELIEMLPRVVEDEDSEYATISIYHDTISWVIDYQSPERCFYATSNIELVDALYDMAVKLEEEGVI